MCICLSNRCNYNSNRGGIIMRNCYSQSNQNLIAKAESENVDLVWDRYKAMQPQCGYGEQGICCRICIKGPAE